MDGDLSLSGTLGGLRIANPDNSNASSPASLPAASTSQSLDASSPPASGRAAAMSPLAISDSTSQSTQGDAVQSVKGVAGQSIEGDTRQSDKSNKSHATTASHGLPALNADADAGSTSHDPHHLSYDEVANRPARIPPSSARSSPRPLSTFDRLPSQSPADPIHAHRPPAPSRSPSYPVEGPAMPSSIAPPHHSPLTAPHTSSVKRHSSQRRPVRPGQDLPLTYQGQQHAQYPQYSHGGSAVQRSHLPSARPSSKIYASQPPLSSNGLPTRDPSYRLHRESSQASLTGNGNGSAPISSRRSSRAALTATQAGVPTNETSHSDRTYRSVPAAAPSPRSAGPFPARRSSRALQGPPPTHTNGSPYGVEGGPPVSSEEWKDRGAAVGMKREMDTSGRTVTRQVRKGVNDFHFTRTLGEGSYSTVMLATDRQTRKEYAIKVLDKRHIIKEDKVKYVNIEKDTLNRLTDHPGVVRLYYTFQDERSLYFVLDVASGGELLGVLKRMTTFDEECTRFYGAQILDTIEYMHSRGVIHRDLKPENVLLDDKMHIKITDFGTAKILDSPTAQTQKKSNGVPLPDQDAEGPPRSRGRSHSFVGTAEYVSPELLSGQDTSKASDLWAFGCIIYQLLAGRPPFKAATEFLTFEKIMALDYTFPRSFPPVAQDLVERLLVLDPTRRMAIDNIKNHEFFDGIRWGRSLWEQPAPRLRSYNPATAPIRLNAPDGAYTNGTASNEMIPSHSTHDVLIPAAGAHDSTPKPIRPAPRVITEVPPPSQLDIEWSPVLTRNNERILKVGQLMVQCTSTPHSPTSSGGNGKRTNGPNGDGSKLSKLFGGGSSNKKRQRMVMITSRARIVIAAADGSEKKSKSEILLSEPSCTSKKLQDPKGLSYWCVEAERSHYTFEDPKNATSDGSATSAACDEWLEAIDRAKELAAALGDSHDAVATVSTFNSKHHHRRHTGSGGADPLDTSHSSDYYSPNSTHSRDLGLDAPHTSSRGNEIFGRNPSSSAGALDHAAALGSSQQPTSLGHSASGRHALHRAERGDEPKGFKRFSKRSSRSGLAAVF